MAHFLFSHIATIPQSRAAREHADYAHFKQVGRCTSAELRSAAGLLLQQAADLMRQAHDAELLADALEHSDYRCILDSPFGRSLNPVRALSTHERN